MVVISNFRETRGTFEYILQEISEDIARQDTPMRKAVTLNRRLAIKLYYLASASEYRTIAKLVYLGVYFVCVYLFGFCLSTTVRSCQRLTCPKIPGKGGD